MKTEEAQSLLKVTPAIVAPGWALWGFTLNEWAAIFGIIYSILMIFFLLKDRLKRKKAAKQKASSD